MRSLTHSCPPTLTVNREIAWAASREKREREGRGEAKGGETGRSGRRGEVEPLEQGRRLAKAGPENARDRNYTFGTKSSVLSIYGNAPIWSSPIKKKRRGTNKKLSYRRETARQLHTSFSAHSLIVHFTEHRICFTTT